MKTSRLIASAVAVAAPAGALLGTAPPANAFTPNSTITFNCTTNTWGQICLAENYTTNPQWPFELDATFKPAATYNGYINLTSNQLPAGYQLPPSNFPAGQVTLGASVDSNHEFTGQACAAFNKTGAGAVNFTCINVP